jgi:hypothetical protein
MARLQCDTPLVLPKSNKHFDQSLYLTILKFGLILHLQEHMVDQGIGLNFNWNLTLFHYVRLDSKQY